MVPGFGVCGGVVILWSGCGVIRGEELRIFDLKSRLPWYPDKGDCLRRFLRSVIKVDCDR